MSSFSVRYILPALCLGLLAGGISRVSAAPPAPLRVQLADNPALSPDGKRLVFAWRGDLWGVTSTGGIARRLTHHETIDKQPRFSPDGKTLAFTSSRTGTTQVFTMAATGGPVTQVTHHTGGNECAGWYPDGEALLVRGQRDHWWKANQNFRYFKVALAERKAEELLFDDYGDEASLSPDGTQLLLTREGPAWWRKGYYGSQAAQIWLYDLRAKTFREILSPATGVRYPLWKPDGKSLYYVGNGSSKSWNLNEYNLATRESKTLTTFEDDSVVQPTLAADGKTVVFRRLFDLYRWQPDVDAAPKKIDIAVIDDDIRADPYDRKTLTTAKDFAVTKDGLEIAFIAGGDLWVMDTVLREPKQVTDTPEEESEPVFTADQTALLYISNAGGQCDIWKAEKSEANRYWWTNSKFNLKQLTKDPTTENSLTISPKGDKLAFVRGLGDLMTMNLDGGDVKRVFASWDKPEYDWSPDGKWFAYAVSDRDFNNDVWIIPSDASDKPFNVSRHPDNDFRPRWSPDGKILSYTGRRADDETDIFYVWLRAADEETNTRDRNLVKALEKMQKRNQPNAGVAPTKKPEPGKEPEPTKKEPEPAKKDPDDSDTYHGLPVRENPTGFQPVIRDQGSETDQQPMPMDPPAKAAVTGAASAGASATEAAVKKNVVVQIDFTNLHERIHKITNAHATETELTWSPDGKKLAFVATIEGKLGVYTIEFPENIKVTPFGTTALSKLRWLDSGLWGLSGGAPTVISSAGAATGHRFSARQTVDRAGRYAAIFDQCWRVMRDDYYDERLGNRNWDAIRRKYHKAAHNAPDMEALTVVIQLMLGELNGSHLGFIPGVDSLPDPSSPLPGAPAADPASPTKDAKWNLVTAHLGVRFDPTHRGPGLKIRDVLPRGPAARKQSQLASGEVILSIDGTAVDPQTDLTTILNGTLDREFRLQVRSANGAGKDFRERTVRLRPISYAQARQLLYEAWILANRAEVDKLSDNKLGYLHISGMNMPSFYKFEEELYSVGAGKEGLVIDVRENGGGSTTDHLLTILTQPAHALTKARGSNEIGYPQDRIVYATWRKPIIVLCNQNSFSNAEIFSHAIKVLQRGKVVGVPTAGGVISTGATSIMDAGVLRMPFRGWYHPHTGEDMELNGAVPDIVIWNIPGELPAGKDRQLEAAIKQLQADVAETNKKPEPKLRKAMER
jgi:tricorn protease